MKKPAKPVCGERWLPQMVLCCQLEPHVTGMHYGKFSFGEKGEAEIWWRDGKKEDEGGDE
jgi:hypothetical protein